MTLELLEPMLQGGIRNTHFFNGRLLTAQDLRDEQNANRQHHQQLGLAIGAGVVEGLHVDVTLPSNGPRPVLRVRKGLAITRNGVALALQQDVDVGLLRKPPAAPAGSDTGLFAVCGPSATTPAPAPIVEGVYVLAIAPAAGFAEDVPAVGFHGNGVASGCNHRYAVEGVQFRLVALDVAKLDKLALSTRNALKQLLQEADQGGVAGLQAQNKLRNWLAHVCFGSEELAAWPRDPWARAAGDLFGAAGRSPLDSYGAIDALRSQKLLDDCDVPLALVCWTNTGVKWVDMWSVRRRPVPESISAAWPLPWSERRKAEGEAAVLQFQSQVADLPRSGLSANQMRLLVGRDYFRYLPAAGFLPLWGPGSAPGLSVEHFFSGQSVRTPVDKPPFLSGASMLALMHEALALPVIDLASPELIWVYRVSQNQQAVDVGAPAGTKPYVVFANGHLPYRGEARYNLSYWNYSHFA